MPMRVSQGEPRVRKDAEKKPNLIAHEVGLQSGKRLVLQILSMGTPWLFFHISTTALAMIATTIR